MVIVSCIPTCFGGSTSVYGLRAFQWTRALFASKSLSCTSCLCQVRFHNIQKPQRPPGGGRPLLRKGEVFNFNNWDNVVWDDEQESEARKKVDTNSQNKVAPDLIEKYDREAGEYWDKFYMQHQNRFFKDRHWLFTEFPELAPLELREKFPKKVNANENCEKSDSADIRKETDSDNELSEGNKTESSLTPELSSQYISCPSQCAATMESFPGEHAHTRLFEVGCGVGNTVFPVLQTNNDPGLFVYCCDLSTTAVELVQKHEDYGPDRCHAFVCDITDTSAELPFPENSLDIIVLIFVLSAIKPDKMLSTIQHLARFLKPGGKLLFRDYGRYDLAQLRFKNGSCLDDNFYVRGDGTRVYFFTQDELRELFTKAGLEEEQNYIDRRLQVNRGRQLKMYRVWIQCKYTKPKPAQ